MLYLAIERSFISYKVELGDGSEVVNAYGADPEQGFILVYENVSTKNDEIGFHYYAENLYPARIYCKFKLINKLTGEEVH